MSVPVDGKVATAAPLLKMYLSPLAVWLYSEALVP